MLVQLESLDRYLQQLDDSRALASTSSRNARKKNARTNSGTITGEVERGRAVRSGLSSDCAASAVACLGALQEGALCSQAGNCPVGGRQDMQVPATADGVDGCPHVDSVRANDELPSNMEPSNDEQEHRMMPIESEP